MPPGTITRPTNLAETEGPIPDSVRIALVLSNRGIVDYSPGMEIKLPQMPFKFNTPDGPMEVTVRSGSVQGKKDSRELYAAAAAFITPGLRALERIQIMPAAKTHGEIMKILVTGFVVNLDAYDKSSLDYRVLEALCNAQGVEELDN